MIPVSNSYQQYFDLDGSPLDSGSIYIGVENANPVTSPVQAYFDEAMTIPAAQPLQTMNGYIVRNGSPARVWVDQNAYSIRVNNKRGEVVYSALRATLYRFDSSEFVTYTPDGVGAVETTVQTKLRESVSVKDFGAVGDGIADDTSALQLAATSIPTGAALYFPPGIYLVNTGCIRFNSKSRIRVYGAGDASVIRQSGQGLSASRVPWHSTMAFDQCVDVTIENMVVEAKGSQYGDIPNSKPATPALCADSIANEFGVALAVMRCTGTVTIRNVKGRYAGDNSVFYFSACNKVVTENCFANAAALSYAGYNADNWCDSSLGGRVYEFYNCRTAAESSVPAGLSTVYGSKGGIVAEGDNTKPLTVLVIGGEYRDGAIASDARTYGTGITATDCNVTINAVSVKNSYIGIRLNKRGGMTDKLKWSVNGNSLTGCLVGGIYTAIGTSSGGGVYSFNNNDIEVAATSVWSAYTGEITEYSFGIGHDGFMNGTIEVSGGSINGPQYGFYGLDRSLLKLHAVNINALDRGVACHGAGTVKLLNCAIETTNASSIPVYVTTLNKAASASRNSDLVVTGCLLNAAADTTSDYALALTGNSALFSTTRIKNNVVPNGVLNFSKGSATVYDVDPIMLQATQRVVAHGLVSTDTYVEMQLPKEFLPSFAYAVGSDDVSRAVVSQTNNSGGTRGRVRVVLTGDVRASYNSVNNVRATLMQ